MGPPLPPHGMEHQVGLKSLRSRPLHDGFGGKETTLLGGGGCAFGYWCGAPIALWDGFALV